MGNLKGVYEIALNPDEYKKRRKRSANYDQYVSNLLLHDYNVSLKNPALTFLVGGEYMTKSSLTPSRLRSGSKPSGISFV